jgi:hypothetical protein
MYAKTQQFSQVPVGFLATPHQSNNNVQPLSI